MRLWPPFVLHTNPYPFFCLHLTCLFCTSLPCAELPLFILGLLKTYTFCTALPCAGLSHFIFGPLVAPCSLPYCRASGSVLCLKQLCILHLSALRRASSFRSWIVLEVHLLHLSALLQGFRICSLLEVNVDFAPLCLTARLSDSFLALK